MKARNNEQRLNALLEYQQELFSYKSRIEEEAGVKFAFVLGLDLRAPEGHPAHPAMLVEHISTWPHPGLARNVAVEWADLLKRGIDRAEDAEAKAKLVRDAQSELDQHKCDVESFDKAICYNEAAISVSSFMPICESFLWAFGVPGLGVAIGAVIAAPANLAKKIRLSQKQTAEDRISVLERQIRGWKTAGDAEQLRQEVYESKRLVYG